MMAPLVSVVIPTYNHAEMLDLALRSVIAQTYSNWEAIVIDNHSSDNTEDVVRSFDDQRISLVKIHNEGVIAASRNVGILRARGEWVAFLDSDDIWYPNKLEIVMEVISADPSIAVCSTDEIKYDKVGGFKQRLRYGPVTREFYKTLLLYGNRLSTSATVVKRSFLIDNNILFRVNEEFVLAEDYDFWLMLARAKAKFKFIPMVAGEYILHGSNASNRVLRHLESVGNVLEDHVGTFRSQDLPTDGDRLWRFVSCRLLLMRAQHEIRRGEVRLALATIKRAMRLSTYGVIAQLAMWVGNKMRNLRLENR